MPTVNKLFGVADPQYDALRVFSNQALQVGPGDGTSGGGLENKIYLWPADGSTISTYDPDQAGLIAALAAAVSGDTVWLPSIPIALTASITVPAGVALRGISDKASMSFSGFSGAAITLAIGASLILCSVAMVSNGTTSIGVNNSAADTVMIHVHVQASGGTATNIAIGSAAVVAREIWQMHLKVGIGMFLTWSNNYGFTDAVNDTTWNLIDTWPVDFDAVAINNYGVFTLPPDGSEFYICQAGGNDKIWRCTNLPAVRAAPATTPTYEIIADSSILLGGLALEKVTAIFYWRDRLCALATNPNSKWYGEYQSGAWSWVDQELGGASGMTFTGERTMAPTGVALNYSTIKNALTNTVIIQWDSGFGHGNGQPMWRNYSGNTRVITVNRTAAANTIITNDEGATLHDTGLSDKAAFHVGGSLYGSSASVVMIDGETFVSADGATFSAGPVLGRGEILDAYYTGGGAWVWTGQPAASNPISKVSLDGGTTYNDKSGDFWTVFGAAPLGIELHGAGLVF